ncbi:LOW QUALITY PROTEIN: delta-sarcoglycan [Labrus bergylta]|uniref:LOW QUALITY PROTEIN: delta-sarcoglycan n=1 Tax=Labrus bergylta TaxID=56723 RepID=UPI0033134950
METAIDGTPAPPAGTDGGHHSDFKRIQILAEAGDIQAICRNELRLESKDGEITLDARRIRLMRLPEGKASSSSSSSGTRQTVYEVCVCPNGRLFLSQAGTGSTCQISNNVCL